MANLISVTAAAKRIGTSRGHVYNLIAAGELPRYDITLGTARTKTRVKDEDLDAYIERALRPVAS